MRRYEAPESPQATAIRSPTAAMLGPNDSSLLTWTGPVSNDAVTVDFKQPVGAGDALRTGTYAKTLRLTLSTTAP